MVQGFRLPAYETNALLDFSPIERLTAGVDQRRQQQLENQRQNMLLAFQEQRLGMDRDRLGMDQGRFGMEQQRFGADMTQRQITDPLDVRARQAQIAQTQVQTANAGSTDLVRNLRAAGIDPRSPQGQQIIQNSIKGASPVDQAVADAMSGMGRQQPAPPVQPQPHLRPQSFQTGQGDPNIHLTQSAPQQMPARSAEDPVVQTPLGPMPQSRARTLAFGLAYQGKGDAGKMIMGDDPSKLTTKTRGEVEEKQLGSVELMDRLTSIKSMYRPEFQTIENRMGYAWTDMLSKFKAGQGMVTPQQRAELESYAQYRADAADNMNQYIKFVTGAAMTNAEAARIQKSMPNVGNGIFDGDSPPVFKGNMEAAIRRTQLAVARYNYLRANGFNGNVDEAAVRMPLNQMPGVIQQRTNQILQEQQRANPGIPVERLTPLVQQQLKREFGMGI